MNSNEKSLERIKAITGKRVLNHAADLCDEVATENIFKQYDDVVGVIHFAALKSVPDSVAKPDLYFQNNMGSLRNVLDACKKHSVRNFIFSSSCSVYGNVSELPVTESTVFGKAESPYAETKQKGEELIHKFVKNSDVQAISLRYFNPVGAHISGLIGEDPSGDTNNLVPIVTQVAAGVRESLTVFGDDFNTRDGSCVRDYIHVSDIANAHVKALMYLVEKKNTLNAEVFNLGSGNGVTVLEVINAFEKASGVKLNYKIGPRREGDVEAIYSNSQKAFSQLGWNIQHDISDMMSSAWRWQQHCSKP